MTLYAIYGTGGCARGVMPLAREQAGGAELVFIDDTATAGEVNGHEVLGFEAFLARAAPDARICIAIADSRVRARLAARCAGAGLGFFTVRARESVVMDDVALGEGAILSPFTTLTSNIRIGRHFQANLYAYVEHDCVLGDFVTFAPGAKCNGNVVIGDHVYVGSGAVIRHGLPGKPLTIGAGAVIGMGAIVTRDVPAGETWVGNPARPIER
jgi:sugar O-acyltransferase (sialic acid O-acetyltransferase NeuD family)